jgi:hypothetical protein
MLWFAGKIFGNRSDEDDENDETDEDKDDAGAICSPILIKLSNELSCALVVFFAGSVAADPSP